MQIISAEGRVVKVVSQWLLAVIVQDELFLPFMLNEVLPGQSHSPRPYDVPILSNEGIVIDFLMLMLIDRRMRMCLLLDVGMMLYDIYVMIVLVVHAI
jgi:hypothetical protein